MVELNTPISAKDISNLHVGDTVEILCDSAAEGTIAAAYSVEIK